MKISGRIMLFFVVFALCCCNTSNQSKIPSLDEFHSLQYHYLGDHEDLDSIVVKGLHKKLIVRQTYSQCMKCNSEFSRFIDDLSVKIGSENMFFVGRFFPLPEEFIYRRLYQDYFDEIMMVDEEIGPLDEVIPAKSYIVSIDTINQCDYFVIDNLTEETKTHIIEQLLKIVNE